MYLRKAHHLLYRRKSKFSAGPAVFVVGAMMFFMMLFDGILGFAVPIAITSHGVSKSMMGFIFGFSSIAGAFFDFYLSHTVKSVHYKRMYIGMFLVAALYGLVLYGSNSILFFLVAMGLWGMYFDFLNFANYDFISRSLPKEKFTRGFTIIDFSKSFGYVIAPIIAGAIILNTVPPSAYITAFIFLLSALLGYLVLITFFTSKSTEDTHLQHRKLPALKEIVVWIRMIKTFRVPLAFIFLLYVTESFFAVIGPLISEDLVQIHPLGGLVLSAYFLPPLFVDWLVPRVTSMYGKKRVAFTAFLIASLLLSTFVLLKSPILIVAVVLLLSTFITFSYPAIRSAVADYISENTVLEKEIEGVADFSSNLGYAIGPMLAGVLSQFFGNHMAFTIWGVIAAICILILLPYARFDIKISKTNRV